MAIVSRAKVILFVAALVIVSLVMQMGTLAPRQAFLVDESKLVPFVRPTVNGPVQHKVFITVQGSTTDFNVWAHPHNGDANFDFWSAVGPFKGTEVAQWNGGWEGGIFSAIETLLFLDTVTFVAIGGWMGPMSLFAAKFSKDVWVFEPQPEAFAELQMNFLENPDIKGHAHLSNLCIDPVPGEHTLYGTADSEARLADIEGGLKHSSGTPYPQLAANTVSCVSWDYALETFNIGGSPDNPLVVKIDTEGSEWRLLPHMMHWMMHRPRRPELILGIHSEAPSKALHDTVVTLLSSFKAVYKDALSANHRVDSLTTLCKFCTYYGVNEDGIINAL